MGVQAEGKVDIEEKVGAVAIVVVAVEAWGSAGLDVADRVLDGITGTM